mgnify:CR=1 FL=1
MGALAIVTLAAYLASFDWMVALIKGLDTTVDGYHFFSVAKYGIALTVMLPATFCAGITLPLITRMLMAAGGGGTAIGARYSGNKLGSIVGALRAAHPEHPAAEPRRRQPSHHRVGALRWLMPSSCRRRCWRSRSAPSAKTAAPTS